MRTGNCKCNIDQFYADKLLSRDEVLLITERKVFFKYTTLINNCKNKREIMLNISVLKKKKPEKTDFFNILNNRYKWPIRVLRCFYLTIWRLI